MYNRNTQYIYICEHVKQIQSSNSPSHKAAA